MEVQGEVLMDGRKVKEFVFIAAVVAIAFVAVLPVAHLTLFVCYKGIPVVLAAGLDFFTKIPGSVAGGEIGGVAPALIGTLYLTAIASLFAIPVAITSAVFSAEFPNSLFAKIVRSSTRSLLEVATIHIGMLVFVLVVLPLGRFTALAGAIAVALVMIPYVYTYTELSLMGVPRTYIDAGYSLGLKRARVILLTLSMARAGVARGTLVGVAKAMGETAPLLFTAFGARNAVFAGLLEPIDALPLMIFHFAMTPYANWQALAWGGAFVLLVMYMAVFAGMRLLVKEVRL